MQFLNIIEAIDEYLDRLIQVRRLLADLDLPHTQRKTRAVVLSRAAKLKSKATGRLTADPENRASRPKSVPRKIPKPAVKKLKTGSLIENSTKIDDATLAVISMVPPATVMPRQPENQSAKERAIVRGRTKQPFKKKVAPLKSPAKTNVSALGGTIPTGPIVVSSQQIRIEHSLRQQDAAIRRDPFPSPNAIPLTAELLTQRWIQGSQSLAR
jgi:hypothetical protein